MRQGTWSSSGSYNAGDVVTDSFDNKRYTARCDVTPNTNWSHLDSNGDAITYNECRVVKDSFDNLLYQADRPNSSNTAPHASGDWHLYNSPAPHSDSHATKACEDDNTQICSAST